MNYFTIKKAFFLVPSNNCNEEFEKIDKYLENLEKSGIGKIIENEQNREPKTNVGNPGYNPYNMMATVIYCFAKFKGSLREMEELCKFDLRVIYLMEQNVPSYKVFGEFINKYILPHYYEIFTMITKTIIDTYNLDISIQYVDGTKIEANANKYKFVWKPTKYHEKLDVKIKSYLKDMNVNFEEGKLIKAYQLNEILKKYAETNDIETSTVFDVKGRKRTREERIYKQGYEYLVKLLEYEEKEEICGENRKSYYKTDKDATAMVLKKDYYSKKSHDFHAAYNVQIFVSNGLVTMFGVFQDRSDYHTFISMNEKYFKYYNEYPENICGDSGYGIYENYKFLKENGIGNFLKFQQWSGEANGKRPQLFYTFPDGVMCLNAQIGKEIPFDNTTHQRNKGGRLYIFENCYNCLYSYKCKAVLKNKDENFRKIEINIEYELLKEEARNNLLSLQGIEIRINRSIQVEGTFGQVKQNMNYTRIRRRGLNKVECEEMLEFLGVNIRKLMKLISNNYNANNVQNNNFWKSKPEDLKPEKFPYVKPKIKKTKKETDAKSIT